MARGGYLSTRKGLGSTSPRTSGGAPGFLTTRKGLSSKGPAKASGTVKIISGR